MGAGVSLFTLLLLGLALLCSPLAARAAESSPAPARTKEYFNLQEPHTALVLRFEPFETEFESRVYDPSNVLIRESSVPSSRLGPVFQLIDPVDRQRQLRIEVTLGRATSRSRLDMRVIRFGQDGPDNSVLLKAYRLLAFGLEIEKSNRQDRWTLKVMSLRQAADIFDYLGMQELQLWSNYYANYYLLRVLGDALTAAESAREIYPAAVRSNLKELALAAVQLEALATFAQAQSAGSDSRESLYERTQQLFARAAQQAEALDLVYEQASAVYYSGLAYEQAKRNDDAFRQFGLAMDLASNSGDTDLANQIRQHAAELHEALGENTAAIALMKEISSTVPEEKSAAEPQPEEQTANASAQASATRSEREMVSYLYEQGRLLEKTFHHDDATGVLLQALELERTLSPSRPGPILLLLGKAMYGAGLMDEAVQFLKEGVESTPAARYGEQLEEAYGILATIWRARGDFSSMQDARNRQEKLLGSDADQAALSYEKALDAAAREGSGSTAARQLLGQSGQQAKRGGNEDLQHLVVLQSCAWGGSPGGPDSGCGNGEQALAALRASGWPGRAQQASLLWSQALLRAGQLGKSTAELDRLVTELAFYRARLPGVLGAWYWLNREGAFTSFLNQTLQLHSGESAAIQSLLVFWRLTGFDHGGTSQGTGGEDGELTKLRSLFAARQATPSRSEADLLGQQISALVRQLSARAPADTITAGSLQGKLDSLSANEGLLAYYISEDRGLAWLGRGGKLQLIPLPWAANRSADLSRQLEGLRWDLANSGPADFTRILDDLGEWLLKPLRQSLPERIYFLPAGRLQGLPLDALRLNGEFLARQHHVINLLDLRALGASDPQVDPEALKRFFLAGNRQTGAGDFSVFNPTTQEIRAVADLFVGPGLRIVQGSALQFDEFNTEYFSESGVLHLAMPGVVDLRNPAQSRLLLSDNFDQSGQEFLSASNLEEYQLAARLAVLSATDFGGSAATSFATQPRLIAEFLAAGAGSVVASLWSVGDTAAAEFMQDFYRKLISNPDVLDALYDTKRSFLDRADAGDKGAWGAFQLYVD